MSFENKLLHKGLAHSYKIESQNTIHYQIRQNILLKELKNFLRQF